MTELADRLEQRGLVSRVRRPGDRRRIELNATASGKRTAERTLGPVLGRVARITSELDAPRLSVVGEFLRELALVVGEAPVRSATRRP